MSGAQASPRMSGDLASHGHCGQIYSALLKQLKPGDSPHTPCPEVSTLYDSPIPQMYGVAGIGRPAASLAGEQEECSLPADVWVMAMWLVCSLGVGMVNGL